MDKNVLQSTLTEILSSQELAIELYFVYRNNDSFSIVLPDLELQELQPKLLKDYIAELKHQFIEREDEYEYDLLHLDSPEASDRKRIYYEERSNIPTAQSLYNNYSNSGNILEYDESEHDLTRIWGILIKIADTENQITIFKRSYPINVLKKNKTSGIFFNRGSFQLLDHEVLKITSSFDFIYLQEHLIICNGREFEKDFDYIRAVKNKALTVLDNLNNTNLFTDTQKIFDLIDRGKQIKKIINIKPDNPVLSKSVAEIHNFARSYQISISLSEANDKIELKNQKEAIAFIKLLNDDYLKSELSGFKYDSKGKSKI